MLPLLSTYVLRYKIRIMCVSAKCICEELMPCINDGTLLCTSIFLTHTHIHNIETTLLGQNPSKKIKYYCYTYVQSTPDTPPCRSLLSGSPVQHSYLQSGLVSDPPINHDYPRQIPLVMSTPKAGFFFFLFFFLSGAALAERRSWDSIDQ